MTATGRVAIGAALSRPSFSALGDAPTNSALNF